MIVNNLPRGGGGGNRRSLSQFGERAESLGKSGAKLMPRTQTQRKKNSLVKIPAYIPTQGSSTKLGGFLTSDKFTPIMKSRLPSTQQSSKHQSQPSIKLHSNPPPRISHLDLTSCPKIQIPLPFPPTPKDHTHELWEMRINDLFFCEGCFKYIFRIEFDSHYPKCNYKVEMSQQICRDRLKMLQQLSDNVDKTGRIRNRIDEVLNQGKKVEKRHVEDRRKGHFYRVEDLEKVVEMLVEWGFRSDVNSRGGILKGMLCKY